MKRTAAPYLVLADKIRNDANYVIDTTKYNEAEIAMINMLADSDSIYEFFCKERDADLYEIRDALEIVLTRGKSTADVVNE